MASASRTLCKLRPLSLSCYTTFLHSVRHFSLSSSSSSSSPSPDIHLRAPNGISWTQPVGLFIDNKFTYPSSASEITTINPYTEDEICSVAAAVVEDVDAAVLSARAALKHPSWKLLSGTARGILMNKLADLVDQHRETLATIETLDNGKPYSASFGWDVPHFSEVLRYYAGYADKMHGSVVNLGHDKMAYTLKQPVGVCGQIIPWNYPLAMAAWKLGPALCCGNTVVLKLAEQTPLSMLYVAKLIREAGFPPGVVNIINGKGHRAGAALALHENVDKISFTGSTSVGKEVMKLASLTMKPVTLETGGKSPLIVFDDANLDQAVRWAHEGIMANQGQICTATSRLLVQHGIYDAFVQKFAQYTRETSILGDPFHPATYQGPQVSEDRRDVVLSYIEDARDEKDVTVLQPCGTIAEIPSRGYFVPPTIVANVRTDAAVFQEEIFGPCAVVARFKTEDEALEMANASRYGLASAVFTTNLARAHRMAMNLEAGMVWLNSSNDSDVRVPFGGVKQSGIGRELGEEGLRSYYTVKSVHVNLASN
ncbi:hypothetical protein E4U55_002083 [Claviceps digitariae]|nr:hypothetical protein E4U55_002083 [Claviceps digitariae]